MIHYFKGRFNIAQEAEQPQHFWAWDRAAWFHGSWTALQDHSLSQAADLSLKYLDLLKQKQNPKQTTNQTKKLNSHRRSLLHLHSGMAPDTGVHVAAAGNHDIEGQQKATN